MAPTQSQPVPLRLQAAGSMTRGSWRPCNLAPGRRAAWWACPDCSAIGTVGGSETSIDGSGYVMPAVTCPDSAHGRCRFSGFLRLEGWPPAASVSQADGLAEEE